MQITVHDCNVIHVIKASLLQLSRIA